MTPRLSSILRTPGPVLFWTCIFSTCLDQPFSKSVAFYWTIQFQHPSVLLFGLLLTEYLIIFILKEMELKGQLIDLKESNSLLFVGSPSIEKLDELIAKGLYISDVPIHDATRDVILVGEQTKAQVLIEH